MDTIFSDEAVNELRTIQDMIRWAATEFNRAGLFYGHGADNAIDDAMRLIMPSLNLPLHCDSEIYNTRLTRREREMLVEYHKGKGEDLVSGKIKPKQIRLFWDRSLQSQIKTQNHPPGLKKAVAAFKKIEQFYDFPQDIEWCVKGGKWYFLQVRPVTSLTKKQYQQNLVIDDLLSKLHSKNNHPKNAPYFYAKTEISEIAPRPNKSNLALLEKIYGPGGPVQKVYAKYAVKFMPKNFLTLISDELFVDKEAELKTLMPSYSYFKRKKLQPHLASISGLAITLRNMFALSKITPKNYDKLFKKHQLAFNAKNTNFLVDYELIFEINLLAGLAFKNLENFLSREKSVQISQILSEGLALFPDLAKIDIDFDSKNWTGNSLDFSDTTEFKKQLSTKSPNKKSQNAKALQAWWEALPEFKKLMFEPKIHTGLAFARLRELGRCLIVKNLNTQNLRKNSAKSPKSKTPQSQVQLPIRLISFHPPIEKLKSLGVSEGKAQGILLEEKELLVKISPKSKKTDKPILYAKLMSPNLVEHFDKIAGIVAEEGGMLSHLAIMARESGVPVVSQFSLSHSKIKLGDHVEIDGGAGEVRQAPH